ncbi:trans-sulfuration enzyme family protein [Leucobacter denitrificans]|uniref:homocysteine desulfhydrase n=1 Tax=Leucobacter denitrificans TaxID=683042 RepID=A0A7G9S5U0_9MICO|nr:PLP-dependent transferase [Leucobacter denitrificans]QNN63215.1 PLP-dependent transferase [Leucobacter denitrificans]
MNAAGAPKSHPNTSVVALGRPLHAPDAPINPHIAMSSTFVGVDTPELNERGYGRFSNESWEPLEEAIATLEGADLPGVSFASGMAAVSAAISLAPIGGVITVAGTSYNGTMSLARQLHDEGAVVLREVNALDLDATIVAFQGSSLVWLESPTNPLLDVVDLPRLIDAAHQAGAIVVVDNTFSTPLRQQPLSMGADVVVHSATKFIAGHSDVLLGIALTNQRQLHERILSRRTLHGAIPGPFEAWLGLRGLRTLAVRLERAEANAIELAQRLSAHTAVTRVRYPGLSTDPGHALASTQMSGYGAIVSIEFETKEIASRFVGSLQLATPATSLGGVETLVERRRRQLSEPEEVPEELVRISVGIEHIEDLWADFEQAIQSATRKDL